MRKRQIEVITVNIHSIINVITNSSTVIFTYQDSIEEAKDLVNEVLKLIGETEKTAEDIFYYGQFADDDEYLDSENLPEDAPEITGDWNTVEGKAELTTTRKERDKWLRDLQLAIMTGEVNQPEWMDDCEKEGRCSGWKPSYYLHLVPKDERFIPIGDKIKALLNSVDADGGRDG